MSGMNRDHTQDPVLDQRTRFLINLGRALHSYGIPAHRLENALANAASRLGIRAEFFFGPTSLISSFGEPGQQHTALSRVQPGVLHLDKLVELDEVVEALYRDEIGVEEADRRLHEIDSAPTRFGPVMTTLAFGLVGFTAARFFGGGLLEMATGGVLGLVTGLLAVLAERVVTVGRVFEFLVAMVVTFLGMAAAMYITPLGSGTAILASLIILLPGLTLTLALNELATNHLVSGTARFTGAMMTFLKLGLGVGIGQKLALFLPGTFVETQPVALPEWTLWLSLVVTPAPLVVLFRARWREGAWIFVGALTAFWGARLGVDMLGPGLGAVMGAFCAGLVANLFARWRKRPAVVTIMPSIILLVPGSIGYKSVSLLMSDDVLSGVDSAFTALLVGVSLVAGLLLANVLLPPRNAL
jgi:uncharacterized membrane protein YjjP (DUF1212 family)